MEAEKPQIFHHSGLTSELLAYETARDPSRVGVKALCLSGAVDDPAMALQIGRDGIMWQLQAERLVSKGRPVGDR